MADKLEFQNRDQLEDWLEKQPATFAFAVAARAALRVLPLIAFEPRNNIWLIFGKSLFLSVFRCHIISSAGARLWTPDNMLSYASGAAASASVAKFTVAEFGETVTAAASAAQHASDFETPAAIAASAAAAAAARAASAYYGGIEANSGVSLLAAATSSLSMWDAVSKDSRYLVNRNDSADAVKALMSEGLWLIDRGMPDWAKSNFRSIRWRRTIRRRWGFKPWLDWYAALAPLDERRKPHDVFGPDLTRRIATQPNEWWDRGAEAVNADIAAWLEEKEEGKKAPHPPRPTLPELPSEEPTAHVFRVEESRVVARAVVADPTNPDGAQVYLDELREKVDALATTLAHQGNMFDGWVTEALVKLRDCLWDGTAPQGLKTLNPHLLRARLRPVREIRDGYQPTAEVVAIYPEFMPRIREVAGAGDDLEHCLPELRRIEAEKIARVLAERNVDENAAREHLDAIIDVTRAVDPGVIDVSVPEALTAEVALADELTSEQEHRFRFATALLATRNFCGKLIGWVRDGCVEGVKFVGKGVTVGGIIVLLRGIAEHVAGLTNIPGFDKIAAALKPLFDLLS